jgi:hypothetical protein
LFICCFSRKILEMMWQKNEWEYIEWIQIN